MCDPLDSRKEETRGIRRSCAPMFTWPDPTCRIRKEQVLEVMLNKRYISPSPCPPRLPPPSPPPFLPPSHFNPHTPSHTKTETAAHVSFSQCLIILGHRGRTEAEKHSKNSSFPSLPSYKQTPCSHLCQPLWFPPRRPPAAP